MESKILAKTLDCILYCDGACRGNPGLSSYGVIACLSDDTEVGRGGMFIGSGTNNSAEWQGAVAAIQFANEIVDSPTGLAVRRVIVRMDSLLVVNQLKGTWKIKQPHLKIFYDQATVIIQKLTVPIRFEWVPREQNAEADRIANQCLDQRSTVGPTLTAAPSHEHTGTRETSPEKKGGKSRRVQFLLDEDTYTAFQQAVRANKSTATQVLVDAVKHYLGRKSER